MSDRERKLSILLFIIAIVFTIIGSTFAYFSWQASTNDQTNVVFTVTSDFSCGADGGGNITSQEKTLIPSDCTDQTDAIQRQLVVKPTITANGKTIYMDLYLQVNQISEYLAQSPYFKYALTTDSTSCTNGVITSGTFKGTTANSKIYLLGDKSYSATTNDPYYLYIWLDEKETDDNTQNQSFDISIGGTCTDQTPTTFTGTIYRNTSEMISIGDSIVPETKQIWCFVGEVYGQAYDSCNLGIPDGIFDTENACNEILNQELENATEEQRSQINVTCEEETGTIGGLTSYETNPANLNTNIYLKHTVIKNIVTDSYVEFVVTPEMAGANNGMTAGTYTLKGDEGGVSYDINAETIKAAFGDGYGNCWTCSDRFFGRNNSVLNAILHFNGNVAANDAEFACSIVPSITSRCAAGSFSVSTRNCISDNGTNGNSSETEQ